MDPDDNVTALTASEWSAFLRNKFQQWSDDASEMIEAMYTNETDQNTPQNMYDAINADYGLTCASISLSQRAKSNGGQFTSPIYVYVNKWGPMGVVGGKTALAYHTWDLSAVTETWPDSYIPYPRDMVLAQNLQQWWWTLISMGALDPATWPSVELNPGWPEVYNTFVMQPSGSSVQPQYKKSVCDLFADMQLDERFYWCD